MAGEPGATESLGGGTERWGRCCDPRGGRLLPPAGLPAQRSARSEPGMSPVPPQPGGSCRRREGRMLLTVATPERMELMGLKYIRGGFWIEAEEKLAGGRGWRTQPREEGSSLPEGRGAGLVPPSAWAGLLLSPPRRRGRGSWHGAPGDHGAGLPGPQPFPEGGSVSWGRNSPANWPQRL